jgi:hypothetical protein
MTPSRWPPRSTITTTSSPRSTPGFGRRERALFVADFSLELVSPPEWNTVAEGATPGRPVQNAADLTNDGATDRRSRR